MPIPFVSIPGKHPFGDYPSVLPPEGTSRSPDCKVEGFRRSVSARSHAVLRVRDRGLPSSPCQTNTPSDSDDPYTICRPPARCKRQRSSLGSLSACQVPNPAQDLPHPQWLLGLLKNT